MTPLDILTPADTTRLGYETACACPRCRVSVVFTPPADTRRCNWAYVVGVVKCPLCRGGVNAVSFSGPQDRQTGNRERIGVVKREP